MSQPNNDNNHEEEAIGEDQNRPKRKRQNHRHSPSQIQRMETFFLENPRPTINQREELSHQLGLHPMQIQAWFQNKRTKLKSHQERLENEQLRLRADKGLIEDSIRQLAEDKKQMIELADGAMQELLLMAKTDDILWLGGVDGLDFEEYEKVFGYGVGPILSGFRVEASISSATVAMDPPSIVNMFMQTNQWSEMFVGMVNRATNLEQIVSNVTRDGDLQLLNAEYMVPSPLISTRESFFLRYCKKEGDGSWAVVDVSIDHLFSNMHRTCRRQPSGCLIEEATSGYSKVTWVEHVKVDDRVDSHTIFKNLSRQAFGANRWVATLERQCKRNARIMGKGFDDTVDSALTKSGRINILKLTNRIARNFFLGLTPSMGSSVSDDARDHIRVMTMKNNIDPGRPYMLNLCGTTSFWVCAPPKTVFDFLSDEKNRTKWDILFKGGNVQKILEIPNEKDNGISVTLLHQNTTDNCDNKVMTVQESSFDSTASFVIYAPVDTATIQTLLSGGGDPDNVALVPSGFAIFPDGLGQPGGGSLLTIAYQKSTVVAPNIDLTKKLSETVRNLIRNTMLKIQTFFPFSTA